MAISWEPKLRLRTLVRSFLGSVAPPRLWLIMAGVQFHNGFAGNQFCQCALRTNVMGLNPFQLFFCLNGCGNRQETVKATGIEGAVFVLSSAVHICITAARGQSAAPRGKVSR